MQTESNGADFDINAFLLAEALENAAEDNNDDPNFSLEGLPEFYRTVWPVSSAIPDCWLKQPLRFYKTEEPNSHIGIEQPINGPCGILSVIQGVLVAARLRKHGEVDVNQSFSDEEVAEALETILLLQTADDNVKIALWKVVEEKQFIGR